MKLLNLSTFMKKIISIIIIYILTLTIFNFASKNSHIPHDGAGISHDGARLCDVRGALLRSSEKPHDSKSLSRMTRCPEKVFAEAIPRLISLGWLEIITVKSGFSKNLAGGCHMDVRGVLESDYRREGKGMEEDRINSLSARARKDPVLDLDQDARQEASVVIPPCTKNEAKQFGAQTGIPGDLVTEWYDKHDSNDWRPYGGNPPMTTKSWKFDLKNFWKHRKAKDDERRNAGTRNQRNGAEAVGKVRINAANDRNNFVDQATLDAYARKDRIKEIADLIGLWINTERWGSCTTLDEWYNDPLMPDIINFIREKDEQLFNKISELGFIDAESGRWTGPTRSTR